ncbi:MAG: SpoIIE family protein phosphatase [Christensenellaceae bacterium]|nr:SpoIIE family protein phosphatase [Christensenellaceae bacterium]
MVGIGERTGYAHRLPIVLRRAGELALMAVLARAALVGELRPFAVACFAAGLFADASPIALLAGCALGCPWEALGLHAIAPLAGCVIVLGGYAAIRFTALGDRLHDSRGKRAFRSQDAVAAALAGLGAGLPLLALPGGGSHPALLATVNALVALTVAPVLSGALSIGWRRTCLLPDEKLSLAILAMLVLLGVARSPLNVLAAPLAAFVALSASVGGPGAGAAVGVLTGAALAFSSANPMIGASLGLMGLIAGATAPLGRRWSALAFVLTNAATLAFGTGLEFGTLSLPAAVSVALLYALVPEAALEKLAGWITPGPRAANPDELAARLRQSSEKRLRALGSVFGDMAAGYGEQPPGPDESALIAQLRRALCASCEGYARCWHGDDARAGRMLCALLGDALKGEPLNEQGDLSPEYGRLCRRAAQMPRRLGALLSGFAARRRQAQERQCAGDALARHFRQAGDILNAMGDSLTRPLRVDGELSQTALAALEREGLEVTGVLALDMGAFEVMATLADGLWDGPSAARAAEALTRALGIPMRAALMPDGVLERQMRFMQAPRLSATVGYACRARAQNAPSGDSHLAAGLTGGRVLLALSDGMGSGARAAEESAKTIRLIRRFLLAEVDRTLMLEAINQLLLLRGGEDMFATADLCVLDMQQGNAEFLKLGACASYVLRKGECIRVEGGRLPLGILDTVTPGVSEIALKPGDTLVMFSDGVADTASEAQSAWVEEVLKAHRKEPPGRLCAKLVEAAGARHGARDDMTAVAARIGRA